LAKFLVNGRIAYAVGPGILIVATDLHGNYADFQRLHNLFLDALNAHEEPLLLLTGDFFHGPEIPKDEWPDHLGEYYWDQSEELLDGLLLLRHAFPERVLGLLGNHDHGHVGGPHTSKFHRDEVIHFEEKLGPDRVRLLKEFLGSLPLICLSTCGVAFTHAAPPGRATTIPEIQTVNLQVDNTDDLDEISLRLDMLGDLLWRRCATDQEARRFLSALGEEVGKYWVHVYGHDVVEDGAEASGDEQLCLSTSFGMHSDRKMYLRLDLQHSYRSALDFREGYEILPLYPEHYRPHPNAARSAQQMQRSMTHSS
jgi:hypothetical protein